MIEQGIVLLVQAGLSSPPSQTGGFFAQLPKDATLPSWTHRVVSQVSNSTLRSVTGLVMRRIQIDVYGASGSDAIALGVSIDRILNGFKGTLPDTDSTYMDSCIQSDLIDFFDEISRNYRRMLEYEIWFVQ